jgi:hypothetical protein
VVCNIPVILKFALDKEDLFQVWIFVKESGERVGREFMD